MTNEFSIENLDLDISCEDLKECFEHFGTVTTIEIVPDKGMALIRYEKEEDAILALKSIEGIDFLGRQLRVSWVKDKDRKLYKMAS